MSPFSDWHKNPIVKFRQTLYSGYVAQFCKHFKKFYLKLHFFMWILFSNSYKIIIWCNVSTWQYWISETCHFDSKFFLWCTIVSHLFREPAKFKCSRQQIKFIATQLIETKIVGKFRKQTNFFLFLTWTKKMCNFSWLSDFMNYGKKNANLCVCVSVSDVLYQTTVVHSSNFKTF